MTHSEKADQLPVAIVGAGMAGIACALELTAQRIPFHLYEVASKPGGRVRTTIHPDGYVLDHGFQVLLEAYPALASLLDEQSLSPSRFESGVTIWDGRSRLHFESPIGNLRSAPQLLSSAIGNLSDKRKLARVALTAWMADWKSVTDATTAPNAGGAALEFLRATGFSNIFIEQFAKPFWGGISLDRSLSGNAGQLLFTLKMFLQGSAVLPARGMQALPDALVARLPAGSVTYDTSVASLVETDGKVTGIRIGDDTILAASVVVATDAPSARQLTGINAIPTQGLGCTTVYLASDIDPGLGASLLLNASADYGVNHIAQLSAVAPSYAPEGKHLIAAVLLDHPRMAELPDEALTQLARVETARMLGQDLETWTPVSTFRIPFSQFAQPPGFVATLPTNRTARPGLYLAGEYTRDSSLNGAIFSGQTAAQLVAHDIRHRVSVLSGV